jgi:hypothetical protein
MQTFQNRIYVENGSFMQFHLDTFCQSKAFPPCSQHGVVPTIREKYFNISLNLFSLTEVDTSIDTIFSPTFIDTKILEIFC